MRTSVHHGLLGWPLRAARLSFVARCGVQRGGDERVRTAGLLRAKQALSQLSYTPAGVESPMSRFVYLSSQSSRV